MTDFLNREFRRDLKPASLFFAATLSSRSPNLRRMARLPDAFDLWVRQARTCDDPARQIDYVLGALMGLGEWHFLNVGTKDDPQPAETDFDDARHLLVFSDVGRIAELLKERGLPVDPLPVITIPAAAALAWSVERRCGLIVNQEVVIPVDHVQAFAEDWKAHGGEQARGFWIPNMTTAEEDFWQQHGL